MKAVLSRLIPFSLAVLTLLIVFAMTSGCLSKAKYVKKETQLDTETVVMKDMAVATNVALYKEWSETVNGLLKAHIILRNKRNATVQLEIKTIFRDDQGVPIETTSDTWFPIMIESNEDYHYSRLCPEPGGVSYQFLIKTAGQ
ncbi:MAG: DUF1425 domain-containing protein [Candidatus Latescibacteria bacterium]|nr:DUF1425 domain-containing protein [Candidatus Latescibacterota bacterium]NIO57252.1 DUF1425 domain-containing protein [Candidatus Latescibacterota bacterium]